MKRGKRKLKALEDNAIRRISKPRLTDEPTNRAERRALARAERLTSRQKPVNRPDGHEEK